MSKGSSVYKVFECSEPNEASARTLGMGKERKRETYLFGVFMEAKDARRTQISDWNAIG